MDEKKRVYILGKGELPFSEIKKDDYFKVIYPGSGVKDVICHAVTDAYLVNNEGDAVIGQTWTVQIDREYR